MSRQKQKALKNMREIVLESLVIINQCKIKFIYGPYLRLGLPSSKWRGRAYIFECSLLYPGFKGSFFNKACTVVRPSSSFSL